MTSRELVERYLEPKYGKPLELFYSRDHHESPRWVARYPSLDTYGTWGAMSVARFRECVVVSGKVHEVFS